MPSIPQSLLWISLVVLWLFVLVPMLVSKRDAVRRTSDVALATRVLNSGVAARLIKRGGPAAGHRNDPDWQPEDDEHDDLDDLDSDDVDEAPTSCVVVTVAAAVSVEETGPDYLDVDVIDPNGKVANWNLELASPNMMQRNGWTRHSLQVGDEVTVTAAQAKDGTNTASADTIVKSDGKHLTFMADPDAAK